MRNILFAGVASLYLFTGAQCGLSGVDVGSLIQQVQAFAANACSYIPEADVIIAIYNLDTAKGFDVIANDICSAVGKPGARRTGTAPTVNGVPLKGYYVSN